MNAIKSDGLAYDAVSILGFGPISQESLPEPARREVVIRYGGWSLQDLRDSDVGKKLMDQQDWYNKYTWSSEKLPAGIYRLRVPVPCSNRKTYAKQQAMLPSGEQVAPVVLVATAVLAHHLQTKKDLLKTDYTRCLEQTDEDGCVGIDWDVNDGRLVIYGWDEGRCYDRMWLSSVRSS